MSNCVETKPIPGCFKPSDDSLIPVDILIHVLYDENGSSIGQAFTTAEDTETILDITTFMGGGAVSPGACSASLIKCEQDGPESIYTLFSKLSNPHTDAGSYGSTFTYIGDVSPGSVHPDGATGSINGWAVYAVCASSLPVNDSNNHQWLLGDPDSFAPGASFTRVNPDPSCQQPAIAELGIGCNDDRRDDLLEQIASANGATFDKADHSLSTGVNTIVPAGLKSVRIQCTSGEITINGVYHLHARALTTGPVYDRTISFDATESGRVDACLPEITIAGSPSGTWEWISLDNVEI